MLIAIRVGEEGEIGEESLHVVVIGETHVTEIVLILLSVHQRDATLIPVRTSDSREADAGVHVVGSGLVGLYHDNAIGTHRTIHGSFRSFQHGDITDVEVVECLESGTGITANDLTLVQVGHIWNAIDNDERRVLCYQALDATQLQVGTFTRHTALVGSLQSREGSLQHTVDRERTRSKVLSIAIGNTCNRWVVLHCLIRQKGGFVVSGLIGGNQVDVHILLQWRLDIAMLGVIAIMPETDRTTFFHTFEDITSISISADRVATRTFNNYIRYGLVIGIQHTSTHHLLRLRL